MPIGRIHFGLQVLSKMKTYYVHSYSIYDIPKTGDFYKDERLWIKENKKLFLERKYLSFENMTVEQQREIMDEPTINSCYICSSSFEKDIEKYPFNPKYGVNESDVFHMVQCLQQENHIRAGIRRDSLCVQIVEEKRIFQALEERGKAYKC